ncbi:aminotransferase class V-fold PLP-dependent enzyme [Gammaproteobacteria bacterium]|nr:aminotransferase class V-fold PLP-dependent enzyme [Gammaproteobacteria bacterium]
MNVEGIIKASNLNRDNLIDSLNSSGLGIVFLVNENNKLCGCISDGDLRRSSDVSNISNLITKDVITAPTKAIAQAILRRRPALKVIPLVDESKAIISLIGIADLLTFGLVSQSFNGNEAKNVMECLTTGWISSQGRFVTEFEESFNTLLQGSHSVACSNGTAALHLCLLALGIGPDDEVIVPDVTFAATINAVIYVGAIPVIADVDQYGVLTTSTIQAQITERTKAVIHVHLYGWPGGISEIANMCSEQEILLIEDCAEALGSTENDRIVGSLGDASSFSFFGNKTITTGEGGMACFKEKEHHDLAKIYRDHGMSKERRYWHDLVGYNYRMTNLQAAIGVAQLERIDEIIEKKLNLAKNYSDALEPIESLQLPPQSDVCLNTYWLYVITIKGRNISFRDKLIQELNIRNMEVRPAFFCLSDMPKYKEYARAATPKAHEFANNSLCLPSSTDLTVDNVQEISLVLSDIL